MANRSKYEIGDYVTIKSSEWYYANRNFNGAVDVPRNFISEMAEYCGLKTKVVDVEYCDYDNFYFYRLSCDRGQFMWSDEMFDNLKLDRKKKLKRIENFNKF